MGEVFRARDDRLERDVAVKIIRPASSADQDRIRRFEQEARAAAALSHPNILAIYDIGIYDGTPYIVSELLEGQTLRQCLFEGPLPVRQAADYALQIAQGLIARMRSTCSSGPKTRKLVHCQRWPGKDSRLRNRQAHTRRRVCNRFG